MRTVDLTVLVYNWTCATGRAYLTYLAGAGLRPRKVLHVIAPGARTEARWASRLMGKRLAARLADWYVTRPCRRPAMRRLCEAVQHGQPHIIDYVGPFDYAASAEAYEAVVVPSLNTPAMAEVLERQETKTFLYTAGGRVGRTLLDLPGVRFIHIHPGVVPYVRGGECLLWSLAVRGRPGASCFYMNAGIDTGDVIRTREFDLPRLPEEVRRAPPLDLVEALVFAYDPHLRGQLLVEVLSEAGRDADPAHLPTLAQTEAGGRTFFGMHPRLKRRLAEWLLAAQAGGQPCCGS